MKSELEQNLEDLMSLYCDIKHEVKMRNPLLYERWKAGGFLVDDDIYSMYPSLSKVVELLAEEAQEDEDNSVNEEDHPVDDPSDLDPHNPVDCSAETYAQNPDLLDYD